MSQNNYDNHSYTYIIDILFIFSCIEEVFLLEPPETDVLEIN